MPPSDNQQASPLQSLYARGGEYNSIEHVVSSLLGKIDTSGPVKVIKVTNSGGLSAVGFVDVQPMVSQVDGRGNTVAHGVIQNLPYFRLQGGANAVILDPAVGDIGLAVYASRDVSAVKATKQPGPPGSGSRFNRGDGFYFGGFLNGVPTQWVRFSGEGIEIVSPTKITMRAPAIDLGGGTLTHEGKDVGATHRHGNVQAGGGQSGVPV